MIARVVLAGGGAVLLLAGCGHHAAAASSSSPPPAVATSAQSQATPTSTSTSPGPACTEGQLRFSSFVEATGQDAFVTLTVTDAGSACVLAGYVDAAGYLGNTQVFGDAAHAGAAQPVHLGAEQHATFQVTFVATSSCPSIDSLRVTPAGQPDDATVPLSQEVPACSGATVSPPQGP